jgi:hypothetical protein
MSPLIEEARRRQRRRRATLSVAVLVLAGVVGAAGFGRGHHGPPVQSTSVDYPVETVANGLLIRPRFSDGRLGGPAVVTSAAVAEAMKRGRRVATGLHLDPATGAVEVRLATSH